MFDFPPFNLPASESWVVLYLIMAGLAVFVCHAAASRYGAASLNAS